MKVLAILIAIASTTVLAQQAAVVDGIYVDAVGSYPPTIECNPS